MVIPTNIFTKKKSNATIVEISPLDICSNYDFNDDDVNTMFQMKSGDIRLTHCHQAEQEIGLVRAIDPPQFDKNGNEIKKLSS